MWLPEVAKHRNLSTMSPKSSTKGNGNKFYEYSSIGHAKEENADSALWENYYQQYVLFLNNLRVRDLLDHAYLINSLEYITVILHKNPNMIGEPFACASLA